MLSLRVSRDKRGYDHIYLLLETRRKGRTVSRLLYGGRWPSPMRIGQQPLDEATRRALEQAYPDIAFDWLALQKTLQQALSTPRAPMLPGGFPPGPRMRRGGHPAAGAPERRPGQGGASRGGPQGLPTSRQPVPARPRPSTPSPYEAPEAALVADIPDAPGVIDIIELEDVSAAEVGPDLEIEVVEQTFVVSASPTEIEAGVPDPEPVDLEPVDREPGDEEPGDQEPIDAQAAEARFAGAPESPRHPTAAARRRRRRRRRGQRPPQGPAAEPFATSSGDAPGTGEERTRTDPAASPESDRAAGHADDPPV